MSLRDSMVLPHIDLVSAYADDVVSRCEELKGQALWLREQQYRSMAPRALADLLSSLAKVISDNITTTLADHVADPTESTYLRLKNWDSLARTAASHLRFLWGSQASRTPGTLSRTLDRVLRSRQITATLLLREKWNYNYAVNLKEVSEWYKGPLKGVYSDADLDVLLPKTSEPIFVVAHPAIERNSILLHAALGHEIGHLIVEDWLKGDEGKKSLGRELRERASKLVETETVASRVKLRPIEVRAKTASAAEELAWRRKRLFQEFGADFVGVHLFGPASLFALAHTAMSRKLNEPFSRQERDYYPPWWKRIALALSALKEDSGNGHSWLPLSLNTGGSDALVGLDDATSGRLDEIQRLAEPQTLAAQPLDTAALEMAETALADFKSAIRAQRAGSPDPASTIRDALVLLLRLKENLPPNDLELNSNSLDPNPPGIEAVLNAAWLYRIWMIDSHDDASERVSRLSVLNRLVIKALEDVTTVSDYCKWKERAQT